MLNKSFCSGRLKPPDTENNSSHGGSMNYTHLRIPGIGNILVLIRHTKVDVNLKY